MAAPSPPALAASLDTTGKVCPLPILMAAKAMLKLAVGQVLEVTGDDPAILEDMPVYCFRAGHRLLAMEEEDGGLIRCRIEKVKEG
jgi:tRNA 2-thiouridine synthesizing protein A